MVRVEEETDTRLAVRRWQPGARYGVAFLLVFATASLVVFGFPVGLLPAAVLSGAALLVAWLSQSVRITLDRVEDRFSFRNSGVLGAGGRCVVRPLGGLTGADVQHGGRFQVGSAHGTAGNSRLVFTFASGERVPLMRSYWAGRAVRDDCDAIAQAVNRFLHGRGRGRANPRATPARRRVAR